MFKKDEIVNEVQTVIGPSVRVEGDFVAQGDVVIEGSVTGKLRTEQHLRIGSAAKIFANVSAGSVSIAGELQGNLKVKDSVELSSTAKVFGDVKASVLSIAAGATLHGKCQIGDEKKSRVEKSLDDKAFKTFDNDPTETPAA
jgi:cytoskeletal protein CcmA (bactofilin family)